MRGDHLPGHTHFLSVGPAPSDRSLARRAAELAAAAGAAVTTSLVLFGIAYAIGGPETTADNWVGFLVVVLLFGGILASLAAFVFALVAKLKHEGWALLWLPLSVFPALLIFLLLGEAFWWE